MDKPITASLTLGLLSNMVTLLMTKKATKVLLKTDKKLLLVEPSRMFKFSFDVLLQVDIMSNGST